MVNNAKYDKCTNHTRYIDLFSKWVNLEVVLKESEANPFHGLCKLAFKLSLCNFFESFFIGLIFKKV